MAARLLSESIVRQHLSSDRAKVESTDSLGVACRGPIQTLNKYPSIDAYSGTLNDSN